MGFKLNLTNDEIRSAQGGYNVLPAGVYGAVVFSNTFKISKSDNPMFEIDFKITEGQSGIGRKQRGWFVLTGKGFFKIVELHKALGFDYPKAGEAVEFEFPETDEYLGKPVNIVLAVEKYASVATDDDVANGVLNSDTEEPVRKSGEPVTKERNTLKNVYAYDEDKITREGESDEADSNSNVFL